MLNVKFWIAIIAAVTSLVVALMNHLSTRSNQREIEAIRNAQKDRDAKRDYEYEARKRLYHECGPILFQLGELSAAAYHRIRQLAIIAKEGNLEPGSRSFFGDQYFLLSTLHRFLAPSAALKILQRRLTFVDLSLDGRLQREYLLARQAFFSLGGEFSFAKLNKPPLRYEPFAEDSDEKARSAPAIYWRQGLPIGVMESAIELLVNATEPGALRVMTYAEFEAGFSKKQSDLHKEFKGMLFLFEDFHPRTRPILWRMLVTQACLYRALFLANESSGHSLELRDLSIVDPERLAFDWRSAADDQVSDAEVFAPFATAEAYLAERLEPLWKHIPVSDESRGAHGGTASV